MNTASTQKPPHRHGEGENKKTMQKFKSIPVCFPCDRRQGLYIFRDCIDNPVRHLGYNVNLAHV